MKLQSLLIVTGVLLASGCSKETAPERAQQAEPEEAAQVTEAPFADARTSYDEDFIRHMHRHAEQLDNLNLALADGDLEEARTPAFWIWRHDSVEGVADEWQAFIAGMRSAALDVGQAEDLESARAAAERITVQCQGCHETAGVNES